jgi:branched-chain amino acid transport system ATP-binding protein
MARPIFTVDRLQASYGALVVLRDLSIVFEAGSRVGIFGHNGSGKSTLLKCLVGGVEATSGTVTFDGKPIEPGRVHRNVRLGIGVVPQSRNVFPSPSVEQCLRIAGLRESNGDLSDVLSFLPLLEERLRQRAGSLSGGEQQMLAVGMALMTRPRALLLDEPTAGLSPVAARTVLQQLGQVNARLATTVIMVEQNVLAALDIVERAVVLRSGKVVFDGRSGDLKRKEDLWSWF